jgi:hypothetical protein
MRPERPLLPPLTRGRDQAGASQAPILFPGAAGETIPFSSKGLAMVRPQGPSRIRNGLGKAPHNRRPTSRYRDHGDRFHTTSRFEFNGFPNLGALQRASKRCGPGDQSARRVRLVLAHDTNLHLPARAEDCGANAKLDPGGSLDLGTICIVERRALQ